MHVSAIMWRIVYRELRALTNDNKLALTPMDINDLYDHVWNVGTLLMSEDSFIGHFKRRLQTLAEGERGHGG